MSVIGVTSQLDRKPNNRGCGGQFLDYPNGFVLKHEHGNAVAEIIAELGADRLGQIASGGTIATVALVPFFILREISRVIGEDKFWSLFFRRRISKIDI